MDVFAVTMAVIITTETLLAFILLRETIRIALVELQKPLRSNLTPVNPQPGRRANIEAVDGKLWVCEGEHERCEACRYEEREAPKDGTYDAVKIGPTWYWRKRDESGKKGH